MNQLIRFPASDPVQHHAALTPRARADLLIEQVERLAEEAAAASLPRVTSAAFVRRVIAARAARRRYFNAELFADPAWDMLLELYALDCEQRRTSVSKLAVAVGVPATTALRWLDRLHGDRLIEREADPLDGRRVWVGLTNEGQTAMRAYLEQLATGTMPI